MDYVIIFALLLLLEVVYFKVADRFNIIDKPNQRSSHKSITLRGGGVVFLFGAWLYAAIFGFEYGWFLLGLTLIAGISFVDDIHSVPNRYRIVVHFVAMLLMFYQWGILTTQMWLWILLAWVVCTGIINAYNFMDGINGITGGYSLAVLAPLALLNYHLAFVDQNLIYVAMLSLVVFCFFNFRTKAKCFAGDVGAIGIAYIVLFVLGSLVVQSGELWYLVFLVVYGVDSVLTIVHRLLLRENIFKAHRKHAYQLMVNELGVPHTVVAGLYALLQLAISLGAIYLPVSKWLYFWAVLLLLCVAYLLFMRRYYHLHEQYLVSRE
ncbi:MAG: glycosyltransferase family 4 protein [Alistipes sp.]|nr:glycosyltransferase family 4 protein [Alistipes sp.]